MEDRQMTGYNNTRMKFWDDCLASALKGKANESVDANVVKSAVALANGALKARDERAGFLLQKAPGAEKKTPAPKKKDEKKPPSAN